MYSYLDQGTKWPLEDNGNSCTIHTDDMEISISEEDYRWLKHRSLRMACKGKNVILADLTRMIDNCNGGIRHINISQTGDGCIIEEDQGQKVTASKQHIEKLRKYIDKVPSFIRQLYSSLAGKNSIKFIEQISNCRT